MQRMSSSARGICATPVQHRSVMLRRCENSRPAQLKRGILQRTRAEPPTPKEGGDAGVEEKVEKLMKVRMDACVCMCVRLCVCVCVCVCVW